MWKYSLENVKYHSFLTLYTTISSGKLICFFKKLQNDILKWSQIAQEASQDQRHSS